MLEADAVSPGAVPGNGADLTKNGNLERAVSAFCTTESCTKRRQPQLPRLASPQSDRPPWRAHASDTQLRHIGVRVQLPHYCPLALAALRQPQRGPPPNSPPAPTAHTHTRLQLLQDQHPHHPSAAPRSSILAPPSSPPPQPNPESTQKAAAASVAASPPRALPS